MFNTKCPYLIAYIFYIYVFCVYVMMESFMSRGLRKGAWTEEEDELLKKCVLKFGEGKWHQVPLQAGLNRCRKSCRIRWLNYLNPSIKRGEFEEDEVDLILKLHRLLGNRWSMIAGRIPERTANDIKNYWNTHLKNNKHQQRNCKRNKILIKETTLLDTNSLNSVKTTVFKPRPRTFSKTSPWTWKSNDDDVNNASINNDHNICSKIENQVSSAESVINGEEHDSNKWWESLLFDKEVEASNHEKCVVQYDNWWESLLFNNEEDYCDFENHL